MNGSLALAPVRNHGGLSAPSAPGHALGRQRWGSQQRTYPVSTGRAALLRRRAWPPSPPGRPPPDLAGRLRVHERAEEELLDHLPEPRDADERVRAVAHVGQAVVADV